MRDPVHLEELFRDKGLKMTPQRRLLFTLLHDATTHPTADELYHVASERMPGISLRTVYQTLTDLTRMGELGQVSIGSGPTRFDPNGDEHHHSLCDRCGEVADIAVDGVDHLAFEGLGGFQPTETSIVIHGTCARCAA